MTLKVAVVVAVASLFLPQPAHACVCVAPRTAPTGLVEVLRAAEAGSAQIFYGRVIQIGDAYSPLNATLEVTEVFKGDVPGRITLSYGSDDCGFVPDVKSGRYLIYADGFRASYCGRSRRIESAIDPELVWLRTHRLPLVPRSVQRTKVECTRCALSEVAERLVGAGDGGVHAGDAPEARRAFWSGGEPNPSDLSSAEVVGIASDGQAFRLTLQPAFVPQEMCRRRVTFTPCKSLRPSWRGLASSAYECVEPGAPAVVCDENKSRRATALPPEALSAVESCTWMNPTDPECTLDVAKHQGDAGTPVLRCSPQYDFLRPTGEQRSYVCRVKP